jgi:hypothetical protein
MWKVAHEGEMFVVCGVDGTETKSFWANNKADAEWLMEVLDEATNTVVKLYCQNKGCKGVNGYITRTAADSRKMMYACDDCGKPMTRKVRGEAGEVTSEKQGQVVREQTNPGTPPRMAVVPNQTPKKGFANLEQLANWGGKGSPMPNISVATAIPTPQVLEGSLLPGVGATIPMSGLTVVTESEIGAFENRIVQVEERHRLLEGRIAKMEAESVVQAEAFQAMTDAVEGLLAVGAKAAKD